MFRSNREALPDVREWLGVSLGCPEVVGRPSRMSGRSQETLRMSGRPSRMSGSGQETLPDVWKWLEGYPRCPGLDGRLSRMTRSGRETLPYVREWSGGPPGCPEVV